MNRRVFIIGTLGNMDLRLLEFIHNTTQNYIFDRIMPFITSLGNMGIIWIIISLILIANKKYRHVGIMCILALILSSMVVDVILKNVIERPRPFLQVPAFNLLITAPTSYSFPSGHTASSFAAAGIIFSTLKKYWIYAVSLAALITFSRLYLFVHYPSDILVGLIIGLICSKVVLIVYRRRYV